MDSWGRQFASDKSRVLTHAELLEHLTRHTGSRCVWLQSCPHLCDVGLQHIDAPAFEQLSEAVSGLLVFASREHHLVHVLFDFCPAVLVVRHETLFHPFNVVGFKRMRECYRIAQFEGHPAVDHERIVWTNSIAQGFDVFDIFSQPNFHV